MAPPTYRAGAYSRSCLRFDLLRVVSCKDSMPSNFVLPVFYQQWKQS